MRTARARDNHDVRRRVLVVEDDEDIALSLKYNLEKEAGFVVQIARDGETGLREAARAVPDLLILDLNLPAMDGLSVCKSLRAAPATATLPILMLTARVEESDTIVGLELGADDYMTKPFSMKELLARVRAVLRRREPQRAEVAAYADGTLEIDPAAHVVRVQGREIAFTRKEFDLLAALVASRGRVLTRDQLLERVWGNAFYGETRTVDVHIRRLRRKLGEPVADGIETIIGVGYRFRGPGS